jgi:hypothetical protein
MDFFSPAQIVGYVAFVLGITGFLQKSDFKLKLLVGGESAAYALHFFLLGNPAASGGAAVNAVRLFASAKSTSPWLAVLFIAVNLIVGYFTATTVLGWLLVVFNCIATYAAFCLRGVPMRLCFLSSTCVWLVNNVLSGSIGGTVLETCIIVANSATTLKMIRARIKRLGDEGAPATSGAHAFMLLTSEWIRTRCGKKA